MAEEFGPYTLEGVIGRGGMGVVYRAYDTRRDRTVALKRLPRHLAEDTTFQERFRRESRMAARLNEPHIIPIHDFGEIDGQLYLDMRLVEGLDLSTLITADSGPLEPELAVDIISQVASALTAAHSAGLVHRDVKPSNVLITGVTPDDRSDAFAYLVDFGIARAMLGGEGTALTATTGTVGTLAYMAPERISGASGDSRSDIYSLACVLYECVTGRAPFAGEAFQMMFAHVNTAPPSAAQSQSRVGPALDAVIAKGMAKDPADRYATASLFAAAARKAVAERGSGGAALPPPTSPPVDRTPPPPPPTARPVDRTPPPNSGPVVGRHQSSAPSGPVPPAPTSAGQHLSGPVFGAPRQYTPPPRQSAPPPGAPQRYQPPNQHQPPNQPRNQSQPLPGGPPPGARPLSGPIPAQPRPPAPGRRPLDAGTKRTLAIIAVAAVIVLVIGIVVVVITRGGKSSSASPTTGVDRSGSSSSPSPSDSATAVASAAWAPYSQFTDLVGTRAGDTAGAFMGATCTLDQAQSDIAGMTDQIACTKLTGTPVEFYVGRFATPSSVTTYLDGLVAKKYSKRYWTIDKQRRGLLLETPDGAASAGVVSSICDLPDFLVKFSAGDSTTIDAATLQDDFWSKATFPNDTPAVCS